MIVINARVLIARNPTNQTAIRIADIEAVSVIGRDDQWSVRVHTQTREYLIPCENEASAKDVWQKVTNLL